MARAILIVDDEQDLRELYAFFLRKKGFDVFEAEDGTCVIDMCEKHPVDLVLTDILMPNKDGLETIMDMHKQFPQIKLFAMSGGGALAAGNPLYAATRLGATRSFCKPFELDDLLEAIEEEL